MDLTHLTNAAARNVAATSSSNLTTQTTNIVQGLRNTDIVSTKNMRAIQMKAYYENMDERDAMIASLYDDETNVISLIESYASEMRVYVRTPKYLNDYENILIRVLDYADFEQKCFCLGCTIDSSNFTGEAIQEVTKDADDESGMWYKVRTNGTSILTIKCERDNWEMQLSIYSVTLNSGNRVYRYNTNINHIKE